MFFAVFFSSSKIMAQAEVEETEIKVETRLIPAGKDTDEIEISSEMLNILVPEGGIIVLPTIGDRRRQLRKAIVENPFHSFNYRELANSLGVALRSDFLSDYLQLQAKQKKRLTEILQSHQKRVTDLFAEAKKSTDPDIESAMYSVVDEERVAFSTSVKEQLSADQQAKFPFYPQNQGTPKLLLESNLGDALKLTDAQKHQIHAQSEKLVQELEEFLRAKRQESEKILVGALTEKQLEQLKEIRGEKGVTDNSKTTFSDLVGNHSIDLEKE